MCTKADLMDGAEGLAAAAVWQLASELHERQARVVLVTQKSTREFRECTFVSARTSSDNRHDHQRKLSHHSDPPAQTKLLLRSVSSVDARGESSRKWGSWIYVPHEAPDLVAASSDRSHGSHASPCEVAVFPACWRYNPGPPHRLSGSCAFDGLPAGCDG